MNAIICLIMRRMRIPLLVLLMVYTIAIVGMTFMPGVDSQGNPWRMNFFEAHYFVSYMGTTIGFGELPYPFSNTQRMWVILSMYMTVVAWIYAIGVLLALVQDEALRRAIVESRFTRAVSNIHEPFYLICGYGDTGRALVSALEKRLMRTVVIEMKPERIDVLILENYPVYVPKLGADASQPNHLVEGGLKNPHCAGVVAVTDDNLVNLHIAISTKLLRPELTVIARVDSHDVAANMDSFGTDFIINPFVIFASKLHTALHSPELLLLRDCLSGYKTSCQPLNPPQSGLWVLCGYGRFGKAVYERLKEKKELRLVVIEAVLEKTGFPPAPYVAGRGTEADTLQQAHIEDAVGLIAGTDDDVNNLSIVMTARELNPNLFVVIRQNRADNKIIFEAAKADITMQPSQIIANHIRVLLTTPKLVDFLRLTKLRGNKWTRQLVTRLKTALNSTPPSIWQMTIDKDSTPALWEALKDKLINLKCLQMDPRDRRKKLACIPLLLIRGEEEIQLPEETECLRQGDQVLWCGKHGVASWMEWTLRDPLVLTYLSTGHILPRSYVWRWLQNKNMTVTRLPNS
ncbi:potassium transporter TrkA [Candidatus Thiomargarita nelsonii]|uniref:Potassium transporter TrkA n=1 Tax=Candidatus Thiomargarita nelsonii TaxID=1003181 RepID=A0A0A6P7D2_9GAMM|nr:potassium transporter TrkA [Candidatus Thiomargarita nelsonii]